MRLLNSDFRYVPSAQTNVVATWKRFGFRPTSASERMARQQRMLGYQDAHEAAPGAVRASPGQAIGVAVQAGLGKRRTVSKFAASQKFRSL